MSEPYPFQKYIEEQKHLDTDDLRHQIRPVIHIITQDCVGKEHLYCDKSQRDEKGQFTQPPLEAEMKRRKFSTISEMLNADKKAQEDQTQQQIDSLTQQLSQLASQFQAYLTAVHGSS